MVKKSSSPIIPIGVAFTTSNLLNAKYEVKVIKNISIDELSNLNYNIPCIPLKATIKEVVMGQVLCDGLIEKYKDK